MTPPGSGDNTLSVSKIEWTDETWNPTTGCDKVSPGCKHCYAEVMSKRLLAMGQVKYRNAFRPTFHADALAAPLRWRQPRMVFVNSMSDLFHKSFTNEQIAAVFGVMAACPDHTFQVLTKRAERLPEWFEWFEQGGGRSDSADVAITCALGVPELNRFLEPREVIHDDEPGPWDHLIEDPPDWPLKNVWLGVSCEDQRRADERIPRLLATPAAVRFVSAEPLLGPLEFNEVCGEPVLSPECWGDCACDSLYGPDPGCRRNGGDGTLTRKIDWVIAGGESGSGARPCALEWIEALVNDCRTAKVPCFVKQLGALVVSEHRTATASEMSVLAAHPEKLSDGDKAPNGEYWAWRAGLKHIKGADPEEWPDGLRVREMPKCA